MRRGSASLKKQLTWITTLTAVVALIFASAATIFNEQKTLNELVSRNAAVAGDMIKDNSIAALSFNSREDGKEILSMFKEDSSIIFAGIYYPDGRIFATYIKNSVIESIPEVGKGNPSGNFIEILKELSVDEEKIGSLYILVSKKEITGAIKKNLFVVSLIGIVAVIIAFILASILQSRISRPIYRLLDFTRRISVDQDYSERAENVVGGEVGDMIDGINEMLVQIEKRDDELLEARSNLEKKVALRTEELKVTNESLAMSEMAMRMIFNSVHDAIVIFETDGRIYEVNQKMFEVFGLVDAGERIINEAYEIFREHIVLNRAILWESVIEGNLEIFEWDTKRPDSDEEINTEIILRKIFLQNREVVLATIREITERKKTEKQLESTHKELLHAARLAGKAEVATSVLHNVGNVLNSLNIAAGLIKKYFAGNRIGDLLKVKELLNQNRDNIGEFMSSDKGEKLMLYQNKLMDHLIKENGNVAETVDALNDHIKHIMSIISIQQQHSMAFGVSELVSLKDLINNSIKINFAGLNKYGIAVSQHYDDIETAVLDSHKFMQILVNLISNAKNALLKSENSNKEIKLDVLREDEQWVVVKVIDNGMGISRDNLNRIFNHGFTTRSDGHGFGLHSAANTAQEMGGRLTVHSDGPGKGAEFALYLPYRTELDDNGTA